MRINFASFEWANLRCILAQPIAISKIKPTIGKYKALSAMTNPTLMKKWLLGKKVMTMNRQEKTVSQFWSRKFLIKIAENSRKKKIIG